MFRFRLTTIGTIGLTAVILTAGWLQWPTTSNAGSFTAVAPAHGAPANETADKYVPASGGTSLVSTWKGPVWRGPSPTPLPEPTVEPQPMPLPTVYPGPDTYPTPLPKPKPKPLPTPYPTPYPCGPCGPYPGPDTYPMDKSTIYCADVYCLDNQI